MTKPVAIFLYELSGQTAEPFTAAGWDCYCIDIAHERSRSEGNLHFVQADARRWRPTRDQVNRCRFFAAMPPCDHLAVSGARWFKGKGLRTLAEAIDLFGVAAEWAEWLEVPYFIENPASTISTYWRKPDYTVHPFHFAGLNPDDNYTKATCLWTGGGLIRPAEYPLQPFVEPSKTRIHYASPGPERKAFRSATAIAFTRAVFRSNFAESAAA
jgi:hypothetical protein